MRVLCFHVCGEGAGVCMLFVLLLALISPWPATAAEGVLLQDDFTKPTPNRWAIVDEGKQGAPSNWIALRGTFGQLSNINTADAPKWSGTYALAGDAEWKDYTFSLLVRSFDDDGLGIIFRYVDANNYYRFRWSGVKSWWNGRVLERVVDGKWTVLAQDNVGYDMAVYHAIAVSLKEEHISLYVDNMTAPLFDLKDAGSPLTHGKVGLYAWGNSGVYFDNVAVYTKGTTPPFPLKPLNRKMTATGRAFVDGNRNGMRDAGEAALPDLIISDGAQLTVTDAAGTYTLTDINPDIQPFIFVVTPSGYRCPNGFYRSFPAEGNTVTADFAFVPAPETAKTDFSFVQITDLHVSNTPQALMEDLTEIAGLKPAFIIATGDLVDNGIMQTSYEHYTHAITQSPVPVFSVVGNHDVGGGVGIEYYQSYLGPTHYAFDHGGRHFVIINCVGLLDAQYNWLERELALQPKEKEIYLFQHYPPDARLMALLAPFNVKAIYSGHWHSSKFFSTGPNGIKSVNSPSLSFGGIDVSPRGFRITTFAGGKMTLESRAGGVKGQFLLISPPADHPIPRGLLAIEVSLYDSATDVSRVTAQLDNGQWRPLTVAGSFTWAGKATTKPGKHILRVRAELKDGTVLNQQRDFTVGNHQVLAPREGREWPMFQYDAARSGTSPDKVTPPLTPAWRTNIGGITHFSSPVLAGDKVFIGAADDDDHGHAGVYALDARTGKVRWHFPTATSIKHTVAVAHGMVYTASVDGQVYAIAADTGKERWRYSLGSALDRWIFSAPLVRDDTLYVGSGPSFAALDARTGVERWRSTELGGDWISGRCSPAADNERIYVPVNWSKGLSAVDLHTGKVVWNKQQGFGISHATPTLAGGILFYPANNSLHALDPATGNEHWSFPLPGSWTISSPVVTGDVVLIGGAEGRLYAIETATGKERWRFQLGASLLAFSPYERAGNPVIASPAVSSTIAYLGGTDGILYALDVKTGEKQWEYTLGVPITASPAISGNTVYVSTYDGTVYALTQSLK
ncbi:MAG: Serine/threonine-protein kinase AfsK [bacterium ADurb.Bin429]|nr:MAG: Serine/threonine-protein kinase AfsK [bacterium ADurb.Bin429]